MNLINDIFASEVFPAIGCTEPISCAYACAVASEQLDTSVEKIELIVDPGTFKNGAAATIPNSRGRKRNVIAASMGAMIARSSPRLEILKEATLEIIGTVDPELEQNIRGGHGSHGSYSGPYP